MVFGVTHRFSFVQEREGDFTTVSYIIFCNSKYFVSGGTNNPMVIFVTLMFFAAFLEG